MTTNTFLKETIIKSIRSFFDDRGFHEVIVPVFNTAVPLEPNIYPFTTTWHNTWQGEQTFFLSTSPERYLKKMLAEGVGNCYAIGHSFRDLEASGPLHSPEFLMLEWYREDATYKEIMKDVQELYISLLLQHSNGVASSSRLLAMTKKWQELSLIELFERYTSISKEQLFDGDSLFELAKEKGYSADDTSWSALFDQIFLNEIESHLPKTPFFLVDFPSRMSPLCRPQPDKPHLAERFEVFLDGIEIGNGNTEGTHVETIQKIFEQEHTYRTTQQMSTPDIDVMFLDSLKKMHSSATSYAGIGMGVDRIVQYLLY